MSKIAGDINAEMMKKAIHDSRAKLFAEIVGKTGSQQSVIDCAMQEIESLRQQLTAALDEARMAKVSADEVRSTYAEEMRKLGQQLSAHIKREVMLRDALKSAIEFVPAGYGIERRCCEALIDTDDLDGAILCDRMPVCMADPLDVAKDGNNDTFTVKHASEWHELLRFKISLYRAWEPK